MADIAERVIAYVTRHGMFSTGQRVGIAVSGGADSMCLLHLLRELAPRWNLHLSVVHIEHGIRGLASREDAKFVEQAASELGMRFHLYRADVPAAGGNLEQAARQVRNESYRELIALGQVDHIATGHTGSDQAETVLYRILRGTGSAGLSGIRPVTVGGLVRPLLTLWRSEVEGFLCARSIEWREDASNQDLTFTRNRLRHVTLPMLREAFNPNLDQTLAHMAILAQDEEMFWNETVDRSAIGEGPEGGPVILLAAALAQGPVALARRHIRHAIKRVKGDLRQIEFGHTETILDMARASLRVNQGHSRVQLPGLDVIRSFEWIRIARAGFDLAVSRDFEFAVNLVTGKEFVANLPCGRSVTFRLIEPEEGRHPYDRVKDELDWERLLSISAWGASTAGSCLELRNWRPGDQYQPAGQSHDDKIKTLFQEGRIPLWERRHWPVVSVDGRIVWTRRFGVATGLNATPGCSQILEIRESSAIR